MSSAKQRRAWADRHRPNHSKNSPKELSKDFFNTNLTSRDDNRSLYGFELIHNQDYILLLRDYAANPDLFALSYLPLDLGAKCHLSTAGAIHHRQC